MRSISNLLIWGLGATIALSPLALFIAADAQTRPSSLAQRSSSGSIYIRRNVTGSAPGGRSRGGGTRSGPESEIVCPTVNLPLTALVPFEELSAVEENVWGYTTAEQPTFWFYVPYTNADLPAKFTLQDDETLEAVHITSVTLPKKAGIMSVQVPPSVKPLQPGKRYRWFFSIKCQPPSGSASSTDTVYVSAVVVRESLQPAAAAQLTPKASLQNVTLYAQNGFWYDALTTLIELRQLNPQDATINDFWKRLVGELPLSEASRQSFDAEAIANQSVVK